MIEQNEPQQNAFLKLMISVLLILWMRNNPVKNMYIFGLRHVESIGKYTRRV